MTPKEKALELSQLFTQELIDLTDNEELIKNRVKECVLIAVDEIINTNALSEMLDYGIDKTNLFYWQEVKQELENL
jgi:hypothetical protein